MANADFVLQKPSAGLQISPTDLLIFGGDTTATFTFDTRQVQAVNKQAKVLTS